MRLIAGAILVLAGAVLYAAGAIETRDKSLFFAPGALVGALGFALLVRGMRAAPTRDP